MPVVSFNLVPDWAKYPTLRGGGPAGITVHRIDPASIEHPLGGPYENSARGVYDFFTSHPEGRAAGGGKMPFSLVVAADGAIEQSLPLDRRTAHAYKLDATHLGVACLGDFRQQPMPPAQLSALVGLCAHIARQGGFPVSEILGHTETERGSRHWRTVDSPGRQVAMGDVRRQAMARQREAASSTDAWELLWDAEEAREATG